MKIFDKESHKLADIFPMIEGEELEDLKRDIKKNGQIEPVILYEGKILDGRNRYKACKELGLDVKTKEYKGKNPLEFVISLNLKRRHLSKSQKAVISLDLLPLFEKEAKKRHDNPFGVPQETDGLGEKSPNPPISSGKASFQLGKLIQVDGSYIQQAKRLKKDFPEKLEEVRMGHKNFSEIKKELRLEKIKKQKEALQKEVLEKPIGKYDVIVIDPPWNYQDDSVYDAKGFRGTCPYPTMTIDQIKNINLPAKDNCVLWLWTTNKHIFYCKDILDKWGFEIKSILTWDKENIAIGRWLRSQTEHCILAIKGKPYYQNTKYGTLLREKRTKHSKKPDSFYKMVDEICGGRKLDYFARSKREGWDSWGDEIQ